VGDRSHIFISYARQDDSPFVERLRNDLIAQGLPVWWDQTAMESRGLTFLQELRDAVARAERLLLVVGPRACDSEYVQAEWRFALENCTVVTPVLRLGDDSLVAPELAGLHRVDFRNDADYLKSLEELVRILGTPPAALGPLLGVEALPPYHVERPDVLAVLSRAVVADGHEQGAIPREQGVVAIVGMTGSGKSVAAASYARGCNTRRAFSDGLLWARLGRSAEPLQILRQLARYLEDADMHGTPADAVAALSKRLEGKRCLIVLDDVWDPATAELVADALGPTCRLLLTTQRADLAIAAETVEVGVLASDSSLQLLARSAGYATVGALPVLAAEVVEECGSLPLSLAMVGAMLRGKPENRWAGVLRRLRDVQLDHIRAKLPRYDHPSLLRAMHASVVALEEDENLRDYTRDRYLDLAVFDRDAHIPEAALSVLWEPSGLGELDTQELCDALVARSLMRRNEDGRYTLHNLQSDYLQRQQPDLTGVHRRLVRSYERRCAGRWAEGEDDGYYFESLPRHLGLAGEHATLQALLADAAWIRAKLAATDPWALAHDGRLVPHGQPDLALLYAALRMAAPVLAQDHDQLTPQLLGRLGGLDEQVIVRLLQDLRGQVRSPWIEPLWPTLQRPGGPLIWSLEGHEAGAFSVAVTPDGRRAVVGTAQGTVILWDLGSGQRVQRFRGPEGWAFGVAVTVDCSYVAGAFGEHGVVAWDVDSGKSVATLPGDVCTASAVAFTPDRMHIVTGQGDGSVRLWRVEAGEAVAVLEGRHEDSVGSLVVTPDGRRAVTGAADGTVGLWNLVERRVQALVPAHELRVWSVALDCAGTRALSVSDSSSVVLTNIETGEDLARFVTGTWTLGCCLLGDAERAVTADADGELKVWRLPDGVLLRTIRAHKTFVERVAAVAGSIVISTSRDGTARVWDVDRQGEVEAEGHSAPVLGIAVSAALRGVCSASQDKTLKIWDMDTGRLLSTLDGFDGPLRTVAFLPGTTRVITGDGQGELTLLDLSGPKALKRVAVHVPAIRKTPEGSTGFGLGGVVSLRVVREGALAWSCGSAGDLVNWDLVAGKLRREPVRLEPPVVGDISADAALAVLGSGDGSLAVMDLTDGSSFTMSDITSSAFMAVVIDPHGRFAVSSHVNGALVWWALREHQAVILINADPAGEGNMMSWETGKREPVSASAHVVLARGLAITAGGEFLVAAFSDGWVRAWRLEDLRPYASFRCDEELYSCTTDGLIIAAGGRHQAHLLQLHAA
jgi:WD40 repeat protein